LTSICRAITIVDETFVCSLRTILLRNANRLNSRRRIAIIIETSGIGSNWKFRGITTSGCVTTIAVTDVIWIAV
jgi:hypothetical protein